MQLRENDSKGNISEDIAEEDNEDFDIKQDMKNMRIKNNTLQDGKIIKVGINCPQCHGSFEEVFFLNNHIRVVHRHETTNILKPPNQVERY